MRSIMTWAFAATALWVASGDDAHAQDTTEFAVGDRQFEVTIPAGFCLPTGVELRQSRFYASLDGQNITPVDIQRCGTYGEEYSLVKYPRQGALIAMSKAEFLQAMSDYFETQEGQSSADAGAAEARDSLSRESDGAVDIDASNVSYTGRDDDCVYIAGQLNLVVEGESKPMLVGSCMTVVDDVVLTVHSYTAASAGTIDALKARSRVMALTIRAQ